MYKCRVKRFGGEQSCNVETLNQNPRDPEIGPEIGPENMEEKVRPAVNAVVAARRAHHHGECPAWYRRRLRHACALLADSKSALTVTSIAEPLVFGS